MTNAGSSCSVPPLGRFKAVAVFVFTAIFVSSQVASPRFMSIYWLSDFISGCSSWMPAASRQRCHRRSTSDSSSALTTYACSFPLFREHLLRTNLTYLTADGSWSRRQNSATNSSVDVTDRASARRNSRRLRSAPSSELSLGHLVRFRPGICSLEYGTWIPRQSFVSCVCQRKISYIVVTGDSNARRFFTTINRQVNYVHQA